jgi:hypothetical protein
LLDAFEEAVAQGQALKQIDTLLLSLKEAMVEAAGTNQLDWLNDLLDDEDYNDCVALDAIEAAAASGHLEAVEVLYDVDYRHEGELLPDKCGALKKALHAAAKKGYMEIVCLLWVRTRTLVVTSRTARLCARFSLSRLQLDISRC